MSEHGTGNDGIPFAISDSPKLFASFRGICPNAAAAGADRHRPTIHIDDRGRRKAEAAGRIQFAFGSPYFLPGTLVKADNETIVATVATNNHDVARDCGRSSVTVDGRVGECVVLPFDVAVDGEAGGAMRPKVNIQAVAIYDCRRAGVAVLAMHFHFAGLSKHFYVPQFLATCGVETDDSQRVLTAILDGCREENMAGADNWRRPTDAGNRYLPGHVFSFAPRDRQVVKVRMPLPFGATKLCPICGMSGGAECGHD